MKKYFFLAASTIFFSATIIAQKTAAPVLIPEIQNECTPVKNQETTGTCWCFSTTSLVESMSLKKGATNINISEMFTVRNIYDEKAKNYILRQGAAQFGEGGLGHDLIRAITTYGAVPEEAYTGKLAGQKMFDHSTLVKQLKNYLDSILKHPPLANNWIEGYDAILDNAMGKMPTTFDYENKTYTPQSYAKEVLKFDADDYVSITSFTHHPFYQPFILEAPDNFANGMFYNVSLDELIATVKTSITSGYTVMWDADVSNRDFDQQKGFAMHWKNEKAPATVNPDEEEASYNPTIRQQLYENLTTEDDHLMHITGLSKTAAGKEFFTVKNSWGMVGPYNGYINVSIPYFAINTVSVIVPKATLSKDLKKKLGLK